MTRLSANDIVTKYEKQFLDLLRSENMIELDGDFDFDPQRRFPFVKLDRKIATLLYPLLKKEGSGLGQLSSTTFKQVRFPQNSVTSKF